MPVTKTLAGVHEGVAGRVGVALDEARRLHDDGREALDEWGYPEKPSGDAIPMTARIVAVADVYDALTSARVYKPAMTHADASTVIGEGSGTQFDPSVVRAFHASSTAFDEARLRMA